MNIDDHTNNLHAAHEDSAQQASDFDERVQELLSSEDKYFEVVDAEADDFGYEFTLLATKYYFTHSDEDYEALNNFMRQRAEQALQQQEKDNAEF